MAKFLDYSGLTRFYNNLKQNLQAITDRISLIENTNKLYRVGIYDRYIDGQPQWFRIGEYDFSGKKNATISLILKFYPCFEGCTFDGECRITFRLGPTGSIATSYTHLYWLWLVTTPGTLGTFNPEDLCLVIDDTNKKLILYIKNNYSYVVWEFQRLAEMSTVKQLFNTPIWTLYDMPDAEDLPESTENISHIYSEIANG